MPLARDLLRREGQSGAAGAGAAGAASARSFDAASVEEIDVLPRRRRRAGGDQLRQHHQEGLARSRARIRSAACRCSPSTRREELEKLARHAPGARVYCRILVENDGADWPLSRKFGTTIESARELMLRAGEMGLDPYGLSFHVGSQQTDHARL